MAKQTVLPPLSTKFRVDFSELTKAEKAVAQAHGQFQSGSAKSLSSAKALETRLGGLGSALGHLGPAGQAASNALTEVSTGASAVSGALGLAGGVAVASLAAVAGAAISAEHSYEQLVGRIDDYQDVTNSSAEEASRAVHMFQVLGISQDTANASMFKLSRAVADSSDKLEALGVHIAYNADGTNNLTETLYAVADAYDNASDASAKTRILFAAFGKSGAEMIDVVEQGSARLRELAAATKLVISDDDILRMREYHIALEEMKTGWQEVRDEFGQKIFPALEGAELAIRKQTFVQEQLTQAVKEGRITQDGNLYQMVQQSGTVRDLTHQYEQQFEQQEKNKHVTAELTATLKQQADAQHQVAKNTDDAVNALASQANAQVASDRANIAITTSQDKVNASLKAYNVAVKEHGKNSAEARQASADYKNAILDQEEAYLRAATAAGAKARADYSTVEAGDAAQASVDATIAQFEAEAATLALNSPLRQQLLGYIADLQKIPTQKSTTILSRYVSEGTRPGLTAQHGGHFPAGSDVWVGEAGPERVRFDRPATVYPHGQAPPGGSAAGGMTLNVSGPLVHVETNADAHDIALEVGWALKRFRRFG